MNKPSGLSKSLCLEVLIVKLYLRRNGLCSSLIDLGIHFPDLCLRSLIGVTKLAQTPRAVQNRAT